LLGVGWPNQTSGGKGKSESESLMNQSAVRVALEPAIRRVLHLYWRFVRGMTLGVRAVVIDVQGRIFLIKHSYVEGWHLPGGGVETGESMLTALRRDLREEGNIELSATPALHGIFHNADAARRDHVALYVVRDFRQAAPPTPNREIVAHGFFPPDSLPPDTTRGTRARLAEVLNGAPVSEWW
jgi:ADP-ribose pyrophosphatase YjhB (NUDIX family)